MIEVRQAIVFTRSGIKINGAGLRHFAQLLLDDYGKCLDLGDIQGPIETQDIDYRIAVGFCAAWEVGAEKADELMDFEESRYRAAPIIGAYRPRIGNEQMSGCEILVPIEPLIEAARYVLDTRSAVVPFAASSQP